MCASSPAIQVNDTVHARVTPNKLNQLLRQLETTA
jgi:NADH:ubiquinone oxidoreductase subunit E